MSKNAVVVEFFICSILVLISIISLRQKKLRSNMPQNNPPLCYTKQLRYHHPKIVAAFYQQFGSLFYRYVELLHLKLIPLILKQNEKSISVRSISLQIYIQQISRAIRRNLRLKNRHSLCTLHTVNRSVVSDALVLV